MPQNETELKEKVSKDIRCLTQAIHTIKTRSPPDQPSRSTLDDYPTLLKAYTELAILLTQGTTKDEAAAHHVAVAGRLGKGQIDLTINEEEELAVDSPIEFENATTASDDKGSGEVSVTLEKVEEGVTSLADLAKFENNHPQSEVPLSTHASDLIHALRSWSRNLQSITVAADFAFFIWLRCHRKICHRILAAKSIFGNPLHVVLESWQPNEVKSDESQPEWIEVPEEFTGYLEGVPNRLNAGRKQWLFSVANASKWRDLVCNALSRVWDAVTLWRKYYRKDAMRVAVRSCLRFRALLSKAGVIEHLLDIKSLRDHLDASISTVLAEKMLKKRDLDVPEDQIEEEDETDLTPDLEGGKPSRDHPPRHIALLYCHLIASWLRAGTMLAQSKFIQDSPNIGVNFHIIHTTQRSKEALGFSPKYIETIMTTEEVQDGLRGKAGVKQDQIEQRISNALKKCRKTCFRGTIHCEATIMALIFGAYNNELAIPNDRELEVFKGFDGVIGVGKKSCFCCYWLAQTLSATGKGFVVPGTHGIVFPWNPPTFGIPLYVLEKLRVVLMTQLVEAIWEAGKADMWSRQSSPISDGSVDNSSLIDEGVINYIDDMADDLI